MLKLTTLPAVATPNLLLREFAQRDAHDLVGFMTQPRYQRFITQRLNDEGEVKAFVRRQLSAQGERGRNTFHLAAEERFSGEVIGDGFIISKGLTELEIGWGLHPALWRAGLGTEIGHALLGLAFERLKAKRVTCKVMKSNVASAALAKRIGMMMVGVEENCALGHGLQEDVQFFAIEQSAYFDLPY